MSFTYLKNPIVLGLLAGVIAYMYLYWVEYQKYKEKKVAKQGQVNILIPLGVAVVSWFLASSYLDTSSNNDTDSDNHDSIFIPNKGKGIGLSDMKGNVKYKLVKESVNSSEPVNTMNNKSYHLIGKNKIRLPPTDVFIDIAKF